MRSSGRPARRAHGIAAREVGTLDPMQAPDPNGGSAARDSISASLEALFDEHAELRDIVLQIQETADRGVLAGLIERLHDLLQNHFEYEEQDEGMVRMLAEASPDIRRNAASLYANPGALSPKERCLWDFQKYLARMLCALNEY